MSMGVAWVTPRVNGPKLFAASPVTRPRSLVLRKSTPRRMATSMALATPTRSASCTK